MATARISLAILCCLYSFCIPNHDSPRALTKHEIRVELIDTAQSQIGVHEVGGNNRGEKVEEYLKSTGLGAGYPWCAAFVTWNYLKLHVNVPKSPAWSPSWFPRNRVIMQRGKLLGLPPQPGDVIGIYFTSKHRIAHVGIFLKMQKGYIYTIEGNTNTKGSREGDGVYLKVRPVRMIYQISNWIDE